MRYRRICNSDQVSEERLKELRGYFIKRGFKKYVIRPFVRSLFHSFINSLITPASTRQKRSNFSHKQVFHFLSVLVLSKVTKSLSVIQNFLSAGEF